MADCWSIPFTLSAPADGAAGVSGTKYRKRARRIFTKLHIETASFQR